MTVSHRLIGAIVVLEANDERTFKCSTCVHNNFSSPTHTAFVQQIIKDKPTARRAEWAPLGQAYGRDYSTSDVTKVVVLGSGTPAADTRHSGISVAVVVNGQPYIFDCGPGFWRNSQASTPAYGGKIAALEPKNLTRLFLTHLHFDHTEGLAEFMLSPWIYCLFVKSCG